MRALCFAIAANLLVGPSYAQVVPQNGTRLPTTPTAPRGPLEPTPVAIQSGHKLAACLVEKNPDTWRRMLALIPGSLEERELLVRMMTASGQDCLGREVGESSLSGRASVFRGPIAEALWKRLYRGGLKPSKVVAPFDFVSAISSPKLTQNGRTALTALEFGDCVLQTDPANSVAMLEAGPASNDEKAVVERLMPKLGPCLPAGGTLKISYVILRGSLAEAIYRQAAGAPRLQVTN